jgi:heterodisulfide reductase subunit B
MKDKRYIYYPGCSLKSTGKPYEESVLAVFQKLETPLPELKDWGCCGATAYMSVDEVKCFALSGRNMAMALAQNGGNGPVNLVAPCSACYSLLLKTQHYIEEKPEIGRIVKGALKEAGYEGEGLQEKISIRHPLDVLANDLGVERVKAAVKTPLKGLKVACYYGCLLVRPYATFDSAHYPTTMDRLVEAIGAQPLDWPLKTRCCGGTLSGTIQGVGVRLSYLLIKEARKRGADMIATACPLCQFDLECFQDQMHERFQDEFYIPVAYFTQLIGKALDIADRKIGMHRLFHPLKWGSPATQGGESSHV